MHLLPNLEACYNRQFPAIGGIVWEAVGVDRMVIALMLKVVETFKHFVCTSFRISNEICGENMIT